MRSLGEAEYWGKRWAKYEVAAADWRAEQAAAMPPLTTERLELRRFTAADLEPLLAVFGDAEVMRYVGAERRPLRRGQVSALMAEPRRTGRSTASACWRSPSARPGGSSERPACSTSRPAPTSRSATRSRAPPGVAAYATEAARAILRWGFAGLRLHRIVAVADPANAASLRVLEKLGMTRRGLRECYGAVMAEHARSLGAWRDAAGPSPAPG